MGWLFIVIVTIIVSILDHETPFPWNPIPYVQHQHDDGVQSWDDQVHEGFRIHSAEFNFSVKARAGGDLKGILCVGKRASNWVILVCGDMMRYVNWVNPSISRHATKTWRCLDGYWMKSGQVDSIIWRSPEGNAQILLTRSAARPRSGGRFEAGAESHGVGPTASTTPTPMLDPGPCERLRCSKALWSSVIIDMEENGKLWKPSSFDKNMLTIEVVWRIWSLEVLGGTHAF